MQDVAAQFPGNRLYVVALRTATWDDKADRLAIVFDGGELVQVQGAAGALWEAPASALSLYVTRTRAANGVVWWSSPGCSGSRRTLAPITEEDSTTFKFKFYCLVHLDLAFKFYSLTDNVHGVLGQTYSGTGVAT